MERLLIRVPLLLVEWLNPVGSGATFLLYHKKSLLAEPKAMILTNTLNHLLVIIVPHFAFFVNKKGSLAFDSVQYLMQDLTYFYYIIKTPQRN